MYEKITRPNRKISIVATKVWRLSNLIGHVTTLLILSILLYLDYHFSWVNWVGIILMLLTGLIGLSAIWSIVFEPILLQRSWRYDVDEAFVKLKHGSWTEEHVLIPMEKVQYVSTSEGPLLRKYGLISLEIGTMASTHAIPMIPRAEALELRDRIAHFAKIKEVD
ncbi:PH domain-containing protein [Bacillus sp. FSL K6-3431]|uniref:PH domain-containing protein n=1 Tax=Bacillus sp. FSL K6-3431 TaxID=2921500 RepID=UPI0030FC4B5E